MVNADGVFVVAPKQLILPLTGITPSANRTHGEIFISSGLLHYVSGANVIMISAGAVYS